MQKYIHYNPTDGSIFCITNSDSMDFIIPIFDEQYEAYLQSPDTWRVNLETLELYQVDPIVPIEQPNVVSIESRVEALEESNTIQNETVGSILEDILPGITL
jgi:hypothetical protein